MAMPKFTRAVPYRRYSYGSFMVVVLHEIESADERRFHYAMGFVPEGEADPTLFVTAEYDPNDADHAESKPGLRIYTENDGRDLGSSENWLDKDAFIKAGLDLGARLLKLSDVEAFPVN